jgi:hypothetical protein
MTVVKMLLFPVRLLLGTAKVSARAGYKTARTGVVAGARTAVGTAKVGYTTGRVVGYGRMAVFGSGVAVGVLIASPAARAGVGRVVSTVWGAIRRHRGPSDREIAEQVRRRLAGAQATWDLPQPMVTVDDGRVRLDGDVPDAGGRRAIAEAAAAVEGVREVDNRLIVVRPADAGPGGADPGLDPARGNGARVT